LNERPKGRRRHDQAWILAGWLLFVASALFFIASAWRSGDGLALMGGIFFLVACCAFLVPVVRNWPRP
jgi:hypothetical protein